jgi:hypothetical protein
MNFSAGTTTISGQSLAHSLKASLGLSACSADTQELFTFVTSSVTGRRAVGTLLKHYDRLRRNGGDDYPVVRLRTGGFKHRDERVGWLTTPVFVVYGKALRDLFWWRGRRFFSKEHQLL